MHPKIFLLDGESSNHLMRTGLEPGVSPSVLLRKPPPEDALRNGLASSGQESSAQEPEEALIDRVLSGHKELFVDLVRPHQRTVYAMVFSLLVNKEDVEDVAQDTLVKALARLHQFRKESTFGTWLIQIAINEVRMRNRKQWRVPMLSMTDRKDDGKAHVPKDFEDWREIPSTALEREEPPAPKPAGLSFGSPSFSILFLQINELEKYLVVARRTEMWLRMHRVPPISPSAKKQRNAFIDARLLRNTNPSVESRTLLTLLG